MHAMGFPRIISKNNKIFTKLGDFCLSSDGNQFWIICQTCQQELQTQGQFWKHVQDEHNFLQGIKQEQSGATTYMDTNDSGTNVMPLPLYRKVSLSEQQQQQQQRQDGHVNSAGEDDEIQKEAKDYTEMRSHEVDGNAAVAIDIKLEPSSLSQSLPASEQQQQQQNATNQHTQQQQQQLDMSAAAPLMYQLPQIHPPVSAYGALVQVPTMKYEIAAVAAAASQQQQQQQQLQQQQQQHVPASMAAALLSQDLSKDNLNNNNNNSTTASASSAVSSDDGERWYICDFENCGLKFKYQSRLELHRSVHSKERRFACEICGASFKQSCNLSTHRKKKHALKGIKSSLIPPQRF